MNLKRIALIAIGIFLISNVAFAQDYKTIDGKDGNEILVGQLNMKQLANDSSNSWFYKGINSYKPDKEKVRYLSYFRDSISVVVVFGTWDQESRKDIPAFYKTMLSSSYPVNTIKLYGVDKSLKALNDEIAKYNVTKVPSIILFDKRNGNEIGRIEEIPLRTVEYNLTKIVDNYYF